MCACLCNPIAYHLHHNAFCSCNWVAQHNNADMLMQDNIIRFNVNAFWKEKTCPKHQDDDTPQCCSCSRRCPRGEQWVEELDGRIVCLACLSTIVRDTQDAQPLYTEVRQPVLVHTLLQQTTYKLPSHTLLKCCVQPLQTLHGTASIGYILQQLNSVL